jgi:acetyl/propionyl-CoA carboxylase alpha subunit
VRTVTRVLIANRGEIARRVIGTCRRLGVETVAVFSDVDANEPFVHESDHAVRLPGATATDTYLNRERILAAAHAAAADALHPGYGFLSEDAELARRCRAEGITFIGPSADAIEAMGSKLNARQIMANSGVPVLLGVTIDLDDIEAVTPAADEMGYPILVKASHGGGGRGMRLVASPTELAEAVRSAAGEAERAFGSGIVYLERYLPRARHVEVQVVGDTHGTVSHLFERDCSVQRRHQKVIEEAPAAALSPEIRGALLEAGVTAARAVDYVGVGTVEFLVDPRTGEFFFLEMNTRLQVEHPVTELVTGVDLVEIQLAIAAGARLEELGLPAAATHGHAIEARVYAEDPTKDFAPSTGRLHHVRYPDGLGIRVDAGFETGSDVTSFYDAMLAKVIAWGPDRATATRRLIGALRDLEVHGVTTNAGLLLGILSSDHFAHDHVDTAFLERHSPADLAVPAVTPEGRVLHAAAAALASQAERRTRSTFGELPSGWRNNASGDQKTVYDDGAGQLEVAYRFERAGVRIAVEGRDLASPAVYSCSAELVDIEVDGVRRRFRVHRVDDTAFVNSMLGHSALREVPRFPTVGADTDPSSLSCSTPGVVVAVDVVPGQAVAEGDPLVHVESMKIANRIVAPYRGVVTSVHVAQGQFVDANEILVVLEPEDSE